VSCRRIICLIAFSLGTLLSSAKAAPSWWSRLQSHFRCPAEMRGLVARGSVYQPIKNVSHTALPSDQFILELDPQTKLYLRSFEPAFDEYDQMIFVAGADLGQGFVRFRVNDDRETLEVGLMAGMLKRPGTGTTIFNILIRAFPDYRIHARLDFLNLRRFQELLSSALRNFDRVDRSLALDTNSVPFFKSLSDNFRDFSVEVLNEFELHVFSEPIASGRSLNLSMRLIRPIRDDSEAINKKGRWLNQAEFLEEVVLGKYPGFLISPD